MDSVADGNVKLLSKELAESVFSSGASLIQTDFSSAVIDTDSLYTDIQYSVAQLYVVMLGRAPEEAGFNYWSGELANGASIQDVSRNFAASSEVADAFRGMTSDQQVNLFYLNAFYRSADSEGLNYWSGMIDDGIPFYEVARLITNAALNDSEGVNPADTIAIRSKLDRAIDFALNSQSEDIDSARDAVGSFSLDVGDPFQADSSAQVSVAQLYVVMLGRAPEEAGLNYWSGELANGASIQDVSRNFAASSEVADAFRGMTSDQQVNLFYLNAFYRSADSEGLNYWSGMIDDGIPFYEVAKIITNVALNGSEGVNPADTIAIRSKVERAIDFALNSQSDDIDSARDAVGSLIPDVDAPGPELTYSSSTFVESAANNGTISSSIVITLSGDTFSESVVDKILVANVPEGLDVSFTLASDTIVIATLTGIATPSASVHDINNLSFTFLDGAFETTSIASTVANYTKTSLVVDFIDGSSANEGGGADEGGGGGHGGGGGGHGGGGGGGGGGNGDLYGDQYVLLRDLDATDGFGNGEPVLDANGQQILVGTNGAPIYYVLNADGDYEIPADLVAFTQTVELERANVARAPESVLNHSLAEALSKIDAATIITTDPAGRIMCDGVTIDSPLENLALYKYLMIADGQTNWNDVVDNWPDKFKALAGDDTLNPNWSPASLLGAVFSKESPILIDAVLYENTMLGVNTVTQVDGEPHVDYFNFNNGGNEAFNYDRESHFADVWLQWYEDTDGDLNNLELVQESLMDAVFNGENWSDEYIIVAENSADFVSAAATSSGMNDFSQSVDDSRAVINFMHENFGAVQIQAPVASVLASADTFLASVKSSQAIISDEEEDTIELESVLTHSDYVFEQTSGWSSSQESDLSAMASNYVEVPLPATEVSI